MAKVTGTCKWFNTSKGYGFITPDDGSSEVFVHQSSLHCDGYRSLAEGNSYNYIDFCKIDFWKIKKVICETFPISQSKFTL